MIILIKQRKISYKNLDKALSFSKNQVFCLKIWKLWRAPTILQINIFCWHSAHVFYLPVSTKECVGFFLFHLDLKLFAKTKKDLVSTHSFFTLLLITQDVNKIKKIPHIILQTLPSRNVCKVSTRNIKIYGSWSSSKFSNFQTKSLVSWK